MTAPKLWAMVENIGCLTVCEERPENSTEVGNFIDTDAFVPCLARPSQPIDPVQIGLLAYKMFRPHQKLDLSGPSAESGASADSEIKGNFKGAAEQSVGRSVQLVGCLWCHDTDILGGVVNWLYSMNSGYQDRVVDFVLANRASEAVRLCMETKEPRLALIVRSLWQPLLMPSPRMTEQLIAYSKLGLTVEKKSTLEVMSLAGGLVSGGEKIRFRSWTQSLVAILVFSLNVNMYRMSLPTYQDQLQLLQCAIDNLTAMYPFHENEADYRSSLEYQLLLCIIHNRSKAREGVRMDDRVEMRDREGGRGDIGRGEDGSSTSGGLVATPGSEYLQDVCKYPVVFELCRWLVVLHAQYCMDPSYSLFECISGLQSKHDVFPLELIDSKSHLYWHLLKYQHTLVKSDLVYPIYRAYSKLQAEGNHTGGEGSHSESGRMDGSLGQVLPIWFVYRCVGDYYRSSKNFLSAATSYYHMVEQLCHPPCNGSCDDSQQYGWWDVLRKRPSVTIPSESEGMLLALQCLLEDDYLPNSYQVIMEMIKDDKDRVRSVNQCCNMSLADMVIDKRLLQLVQVLFSYHKKLSIQQMTASTPLTSHEQRYQTLWSNDGLDEIHNMIQWICNLVEYTMVKDGSRSILDGAVSQRAWANIQSGDWITYDQFKDHTLRHCSYQKYRALFS